MAWMYYSVECVTVSIARGRRGNKGSTDNRVLKLLTLAQHSEHYETYNAFKQSAPLKVHSLTRLSNFWPIFNLLLVVSCM